MSGSFSFPPFSSSASGITSSEKKWTSPEGTAHERCTLLTFIKDRFLGESLIDPGETPEMGYRRGGVAFFCTSCGEIWGRLVLVSSEGEQTPFDKVERVACDKHYDQWEVSGSLLSGYRNEGYLKYLPLEAVKREFIIYLREERK